MALAGQQTTPQEKLNAAAREGDISRLYGCIQDDPHILDGIDKIPYVDTPLHIAASAGHPYFALEMVRLMPSFGKKLNPQGLSPLDLALRNGHSDTVSRLINFDKELIRVKGRESFTPLHSVAEIGDVDLLAKFLFVCPESIRDRTIRDETAMHIAVKHSKLEAFKVLLVWLCKINEQHVLNWENDEGNTVLHIAVSTSQPQIVKFLVGTYGMNKNGRNLEGLTALDVAESLGDGEVKTEIVNALRSKGISGRSSLHNVYSLVEFFTPGLRDMSMEMRNMILVVAALIATATFQAVLSPPGGVPDNHNLPTNGTLSPNLPAANNTITDVFSTTSTNPYKRVLFGKLKYEIFFYLFYSLNTLCFTVSIMTIILVLPSKYIFSVLDGSLVNLTLSYGMSFLIISPSYWYAWMSMSGSYLYVSLAYLMKCFFVINNRKFMAEGNVPLMSHSQLKISRIQMLRRLVDRL